MKVGGNESATKFFQSNYLQRDENLLLAIDKKSPYQYYTVRGIDHRLSMTWMWCWPWENTARAEFVETIPRRARPLGGCGGSPRPVRHLL